MREIFPSIQGYIMKSNQLIFNFLTAQTGRYRTKTKGQGMVEFALSIGVFLLLVFGVLEFGYLLYCYSTVFSSAREAARFGASIGTNEANIPHEKDCDGIRQAAIRIGGMVGVSDSNVIIRYDHGPTDTRHWEDLPTCKSTRRNSPGRSRGRAHLGFVQASNWYRAQHANRKLGRADDH